MGKINEEWLKKMGEVIDMYKEHWAHQSNHSDCSECYKEEQGGRKTHEEMLEKYPALKNPHGANYPVGFNPNNL